MREVHKKIQKTSEGERKNTEECEAFHEEVSGINTRNISMSHVVIYNPVCYDKMETKKEYLRRLKAYIQAGGWQKRKFVHAELDAYQKILSTEVELKYNYGINYYQYFLLLDVMHILSYELKAKDQEKMEKAKRRYFEDFAEDEADPQVVHAIVKSFLGAKVKFDSLLQNKKLLHEKTYIRMMKKNYLFREKKGTTVMITATMSAGKSTFINAITGKHICLSQNMACTSKIHCIVNKAYEDGFSYEYDHDLVLTADKEELLHDNERNTSDKIIVGTCFDGCLKNCRLILNDSPGVNYSENAEHREITDRMIRKKNYNLLIYVMNATQLATNDEDEHLNYIKRMTGRIPVLFVVNKVDTFNPEEEDISAVIQRQREYLKSKGFKEPLLCPVSSRAGYLAKQFRNGKLSRTELRELYNYVDKFEQMKLSAYYARAFNRIKVANSESEEEQLLKTSGLAYIERIIGKLVTGGKVNGTSIR